MAIVTSTKSPLDIRKHITKGFELPGLSEFDKTKKDYKRNGEESVFSPRYDEPTYLTFRVQFLINDRTEEIASKVDGPKAYDYNPHPLLIKTRNVDNGSSYSTVDYLRNALGETIRADLLEQFIDGLNDLQEYCPYYFTEIIGLGGLFKVDPIAGRRVKKDAQVITIKCNEALDMRIGQILSVYRKVVWDDTYQRWAVPDMMRFFKMKIYISEMRCFHRPKMQKLNEIVNGVVDVTNNLSNNNTENPLSSFILAHDALNEVMPTICLEMSQCEFDISDTLGYVDSLKSAKGDSPSPSLRIKVGNVKETHVYGLNKNMEKIIEDVNNSGYPKFDKIVYTDILSDDILRDYYYFDDDETKSSLSTYYKNIIDVEKPSTTQNRFIDKGVKMPEDEYNVFDAGRFNQNMISEVLNEKIDNLKEKFDNNEDVYGNIIKDMILNNSYIQEKLPLSTANINPIITQFDILDAIGKAKTEAILWAIKDSIYHSTATEELGNEYASTALQNVLQEVSMQAEDKSIPLVQTIDWMLNSGMSATDMGRYIDEQYDKMLTGSSNEAVIDALKKYIDPGLIDAKYRSTANENDAVPAEIQITPYISTANINPAVPAEIQITPYVSTANENEGNLPELENAPYLSTANENEGNPPEMENTPYLSTANENEGNPPEMENAPYISTANINPSVPTDVQTAEYQSTANNGSIDKQYDEKLVGPSNEVLSDLNNRFKSPGLINPKYTSMANIQKITPTEAKNIPYASTAINTKVVNDNAENASYTSTANNDKIIDVELKNPQYRSTAINTKVGAETVENIPYVSTANESEEIEIEIKKIPYKSTANEDNKIELDMQNSKYHSTANNGNVEDTGMKNAESLSEVVGKEIDGLFPKNHLGTSNEAIDDLDNGYKNPGLINPKYISKATNTKVIGAKDESERLI